MSGTLWVLVRWMTGESADFSKPTELTPGTIDPETLGYLPDEGFLLQLRSGESGVAAPSGLCHRTPGRWRECSATNVEMDLNSNS